MTEYIITDEQLKTAAEAYSEHELSLPITEVFISGEKLTEIVRCRDCACVFHRKYNNGFEYQTCSYFDSEYAEVEPDGFCAWGERK